MSHLERWCPAYPHANSHATALVATRGPREPPPGHGPPAPHPLGPPASAVWMTPRSRGLQFLQCNPRGLLSSSNPSGASQRWCRRPAPLSASGVLYPDAMRLLAPHQHQSAPHRHPSTAVVPTAVVALGGPVNSGSGQVGVHDTTHPARGQVGQHEHPMLEEFWDLFGGQTGLEDRKHQI